MAPRLQTAKASIDTRLHELQMDHGGPPEERRRPWRTKCANREVKAQFDAHECKSEELLRFSCGRLRTIFFFRSSCVRFFFNSSSTATTVNHQEKSRNSPERFSKLARAVSSCRLPQFNRISFRVAQAGEAAVGIRLRVNLDLDSGGS